MKLFGFCHSRPVLCTPALAIAFQPLLALPANSAARDISAYESELKRQQREIAQLKSQLRKTQAELAERVREATTWEQRVLEPERRDKALERSRIS